MLDQTLADEIHNGKEKIIALHRMLSDTALEPSPDVNELFSRLVTLVTSGFSDKLAEDLLRDPDIQDVLPSLQRINARGEDLLERHWSRLIVASDAPADNLLQFPYYDNYRNLVRMEFHALCSVREGRPHRGLLIGGGALPLTAILLAGEHDVAVDAIEFSTDAYDLARRLIDALQLHPRIGLQLGDVRAFTDFKRYDFVVLAALVGETQGEKSRIIAHIKQYVGPGTAMVLRTAHGLRQLLYRPLVHSDLDGLVRHMIVHPCNGVINSIVVAEGISEGASRSLAGGRVE